MGNAILNWGVLVVGLVLFFFGILFILQYARAYKRQVMRRGRSKFGKEYGTSWDKADTRGVSGMIILWIIVILAVVGLPLFFFTGLAEVGLPLFIGCTIGIAGILLFFLASIGAMGIAKRDVDIVLSNMEKDKEDD